MNTPTQLLGKDVLNASRRLYRGTSVMNFRLSSTDTNNALSIIDVHMYKGTEPPRHVHDHEDETFIVMDGEVTFFISEMMIKAYPGEIVFAPRGVAHSFRIDTETAKFRLVITPGKFDQFFWQQSTPYSAGDPIKPIGPPSPQALAGMMKLATDFGTRFI